MMRRLVVATLFALVSLIVGADRLELANGDVITGTITSMDAERVVIQSAYGALEIPRSSVIRGTFGDETPGVGVERAPAASTTGEALPGSSGSGSATVGSTSPAARIDRDAEGADRPSREPIVRVPLDGTIRDVAGGHTVVNNGLTFTEDRFGRLNGALRSDGTGTYLSVTPSAAVNELDAFTVLFRVRLGSLDGPVYLVSKWGRADGQIADGKFTVQSSDGAITLFVVGPDGRYGWTAARGVLSAGRWHSVAVTFESARGAIFVDGTEVRTRTFPFEELYTDDAPLLVMTAEAATDDPYALYNATGTVDDLELYDHALDADAIAEWAAATPL